MKNFSLISIIFVLIQGCGTKKEWTTFKFYNNQIQVSFLTKDFKVDTTFSKSEIGFIPAYSFIHETQKDDFNEVYLLAITPLPDTIKIDEQALFDLELERTKLAQNSIYISNQIDNSIEGCEGRQYVFSMKNGSLNLYGRYIMCKNVFITMTVLTRKENFYNNQIYEFLNSLKVSDELKGNVANKDLLKK